MSTRRVLSVLVIAGALVLSLGTYWAAANDANVSPIHAALGSEAASAFTRYYNLLGYEGIGTLGSNLQAYGRTPPVGDYVTTHCRYIDVPNTDVGDYYLRYPLHLPQGAAITNVSLYVADYSSSGILWALLRSRPWDSADIGYTEGFALTNNLGPGDRTIGISSLDVTVDNQTREYWIDVTPSNDAIPSRLCVYGIRVTYSVNGALLPLIDRGG